MDSKLVNIRFLIFSLLLFLLSNPLSAQTGHWEKLNPLNNPGTRSSHGMAKIGQKKVLLFGGSTVKPFNDTWLFDLEKSNWQKIDCKNSPTPRDGHGMCQISEKEVLLFGGSGFSSLPEFNDLWLFDLDSMDWRQLNPKGMNDSIYPPLTNRMGMAKLSENSVIIYGGEVRDSKNPNRDQSSDTWVYHIDKNEWEMCFGKTARETSDLSLIEIDSNVVLLIGGTNSMYVNNYIFDDIRNNWNKIIDLKTNLDCITIYGSASANLANGLGLLFGGITAYTSTGKTGYDSTWIFNYNAKSWTKLNLNPHPSDRIRGSMAKIDTNKALLFGGDSQTNRRPEDTWLFVLDSLPSDVREYNLNNNYFSISPNPATDFIEISYPSESLKLSEGSACGVRIYDVFGELINPTPAFPGREGVSSSHYSLPTTQYLKLDVSTLVPGLYFVRVGERTGKFIKY